MKLLNSFKNNLIEVNSSNFNQFALGLFKFQAKNNKTYRNYIHCLNIDDTKIGEITQIPFLPIDFFKHHKIKTGDWPVKETFLSSGTTSTNRSRHFIEDSDFYLRHARHTFESFYGDITEIAIFALLPSYLAQGNSSLIKMTDHFIAISDCTESGFYLEDFEVLTRELTHSLSRNKKTILFGVGYALLDFADQTKSKFDELTIIETGGMKGRRKELTKDEFYGILKDSLGKVNVHSEYGMTEMMSQAYAQCDQVFVCPPHLKVLIRDINDPFRLLLAGETGGVNIIDLANSHSCAFIETKDLGLTVDSGRFQILGRMDNSDIRGCNLLIS